MKTFDIQVNINQDTYDDEFILRIIEDKVSRIFVLDTPELLDLYQEIKHAVDTNIC